MSFRQIIVLSLKESFFLDDFQVFGQDMIDTIILDVQNLRSIIKFLKNWDQKGSNIISLDVNLLEEEHN